MIQPFFIYFSPIATIYPQIRHIVTFFSKMCIRDRCVHVQGGICKMGVGVYHGVQAPVLQLPRRPGNKGGERVRCQSTQAGILHVDGSRQLKPLSPEGIVQEGQLSIPLWGSNGTAVIVDPHRDEMCIRDRNNSFTPEAIEADDFLCQLKEHR